LIPHGINQGRLTPLELGSAATICFFGKTTQNSGRYKMIKNRIIVAIAAVLVIVLGIQFYIMFRLNDRLNQLSGQENQADSPQIKIPKLPNLTFPSRVRMTSSLRITHGILMKKCSVCKKKWSSFSVIHFSVFI
jgi:hypothetical protein